MVICILFKQVRSLMIMLTKHNNNRQTERGTSDTNTTSTATTALTLNKTLCIDDWSVVRMQMIGCWAKIINLLRKKLTEKGYSQAQTQTHKQSNRFAKPSSLIPQADGLSTGGLL